MKLRKFNCFLFFCLQSFIGLKCGHKFCIDCCSEYAKVKIMDDGESDSVRCLDSECCAVFDDITVMKLLKSYDIQIRYQRLITNSFVEVNKIV